MGKKRNFDEPVNEQVEDEYYIEEDSSTVEEEEMEKKPVTNSDKDKANLLKAETEAKKVEIEAKKLDFEIEEAKYKRELDSKKLDLELKKLENDRQLEEKRIEIEVEKNSIEKTKADNENKNAKKERISNYIKAGLGVAGVAISSLFSGWAFCKAMQFEENGSFRTTVGKLANGFVKDSAKKAENVGK